jgi:glycosyltransferase involved in cell wall biosynthesis
MNILFLTPLYRPTFYKGYRGGGEISNQLIFSELARRGHQIVVISMSSLVGKRTYVDSFEVIEPFHFFPQNKIYIAAEIVFIKSYLNRYLTKNTPDVILSATSLVPLAASLGKKFSVPAGAIIRALENYPGGNPPMGTFVNDISRLWTKLTIGLHGENELDKIDFAVTVSQYMKDKYSKIFSNLPISIIYPPHAVDLLPRKQVDKIRKVLMIGAEKSKGVDIFFALAQHYDSLEFVIVGDKSVPTGEVIKNNNIIRYGWTSNVAGLINISDLVLVPSIVEDAFPRASIQALMAGKIVLVSARGGLPETVGYQPDLIIETGDIEGWTNRIDGIISDPTIHDAALENARQYLGKYSLTNQVDRLEATLHEILSSFHRMPLICNT